MGFHESYVWKGKDGTIHFVGTYEEYLISVGTPEIEIRKIIKECEIEERIKKIMKIQSEIKSTKNL